MASMVTWRHTAKNTAAATAMASAMAQQPVLGAAAPVAQLRRGRPAGCGRRSKRVSVVAPQAVLAEPPAVPDEAPVLSGVDMWLDAARPKATPKRLQTQTAQVAPNTTVIRSLDYDRCVARPARLCPAPTTDASSPRLTRLPCSPPQRCAEGAHTCLRPQLRLSFPPDSRPRLCPCPPPDRFDIEFGLSDGTTYNSYVIQGDGLVAVVDCSHAKFSEQYFAALLAVVGDMSRITHLVVSHTEPDHSGLVARFLELAPQTTVVGARVCLQFLANLVHAPFTSLEVKQGSSLDLGGGHVLDFVPAPNLHWPDTMFTFDRATGVLFTCDAFGAHFCSPEVFDSSPAALEPHYRFYYECLMKPNARSVVTALRKVEGLGITTIAVGHGPVLRLNVPDWMAKYGAWSADALKKASATVAVLYTAEYGFGDRLSQALARGLTKTEVETVMLDLSTADAQEVSDVVARAKGVVLMTPPAQGRAHDALASVLAGAQAGQPFLVAESYGGQDEPVDTLSASLLAAGAQLAAPALRCKDTPSEGTYQTYEESGTDLGQALTAAATLKAQKTGLSPQLAKALGRVSGGLYLLTAVRGDARSAMIASWVAQAGFNPPAFTVAVAKDRAIESLMQVGDAFVLNCLPEGGHVPLMKHFLRRFPPGADRFAGVAWSPGPRSGCPVLQDAAAFLECRVTSRMEAGDHWIVLATVEDGATLRPDTRTAVHHRKVGSYY